MKKTVVVAAFFVNVFVVFSQDLGPGGVGSTESIDNDYMLWMRGDKEVTSRENLGAVFLQGNKYRTTWEDMSGKGNIYTGELTTGLFGTYSVTNIPQLITNAQNGLPLVNFETSNNYLIDSSISGQQSDDSHTVIMVWKSNEINPSDGRNVIGSTNSFTLNTNNNQFRITAENGATDTNYSFGDVSDYTSPTISFISKTDDDRLKIYRNGVLTQNHTLSNTNHLNWSSSSSITMGVNMAGNTANSLQQNFYEVIHTTVDFDTEIVNKILIENYLSAKYNIALGQNDVYKGDDEGYDYQVAGIGKDTNNNINDSAQGTGIVAISNPSDLDTDEYLMWGQNMVEDYSSQVINDPQGERTMNTWNVSSRKSDGTTVADVGTVTLKVNVTQSLENYNNENPQKFRLIVSSDSNFTQYKEYIADISGTVATFTDVDLDDGDYFTFEFTYDREIVYNGTTWSPKVPSTTTEGYKVTVESGTVNLGSGDFKIKSLELQNSSVLIFDENATITVEEEIHIGSSAALYLYDGAQLLQNSTEVNTGTNFYIPFTTPAKDSYSFSYISSPVSNNNSTYTFVDNFKDGRVGDDIVNNETSFVFYNSDSDGAQTNTMTALSTHWMYTYFNSEDWVLKRSTGTVLIGQGVTVKEGGTSAQRYYAKGTPNNGSYSLTVDENTISLLGNPYPSALDANTFLEDNPLVSTLYFYEDKAGVESHYQNDYDAGYGVYTAFGGGIAASVAVSGASFSGTAPTRYIPVGQGFMADTTEDGTIQFKNTQRVMKSIGADSKFFKQEKPSNLLSVKQMKVSQETDEFELPSLRVGFEFSLDNEKAYHRQLGINFKEGNSIDNFDIGYDAILFDEKPSDAYIINQQDEKYVMAGISQITEASEIPIYVVLDQSREVSFMIDENENVHHEIYLYDKELGSKERLDDGSIVKKNLTTGTYSDRFLLVFKEDESLSSLGLNKENLKVFIDKNQIVVDSEDYQIKSLSLINMNGGLIISSSQNILKYQNIIHGVYLLKIHTYQGTMVKKVAL